MNHFVRFGSHQESKVILDDKVKSNIKGLTFNANVIGHTPVALHKFINIHFPDKPYFIDPQTYIFQLDPIKYYSNSKKGTHGKLKKSVNTIVERYGKPVRNIANNMKPLDSVDFEGSMEVFTKNVIEFQLNFLNEEYSKKESEGFEDYDDGNSAVEPNFIIPPYFYLTFENFDSWFQLNMEAYNNAVKYTNREIVPQLVIEKHILLMNDKLGKLIDFYNGIDSKFIFLWIDDFNESEVNLEYLNAFIKFLKKINKKIINLYGGYFSLLLCKIGLLEGFCHGPGYGEHRSVKPVGGGIPNAKYYLPFTATRVNFQEAFSVLSLKNLLSNSNDYFKYVCQCKKCKELLSNSEIEDAFFGFGHYEPSKKSGREIPTQTTLINNNLHFLLRRFIDIKKVKNKEEISKFREFIRWNEEYKEVSTTHLENWIAILENEE